MLWFTRMHLEELQLNDARCERNETILWKVHAEKFWQWVKEKVYCSVVFNIVVYNIVLKYLIPINRRSLLTQKSMLRG